MRYGKLWSVGVSYIKALTTILQKLKAFRNLEIRLRIVPFFGTFLYLCTMNIVEILTGEIYPIEVLPVENIDYKSLTKTRYFFNWKEERKHEVYKLVRKGQHDILGLVSIERIPSEWRIHIRLLTVSLENKGEGKVFEKIVGNLIAFVSKIAVKDFGELACVSLRPKSAIAQHYITKYNMNVTGMTLSLEVPEIINHINQYNHDE